MCRITFEFKGDRDYSKKHNTIKSDFPAWACIEFTKRCNFYCSYCFAGEKTQGENELTTEEYKSYFSQLKKLNFKQVSLLGGEPLLRKDFWKLLKEMRDHNFQVKLATNCTLLDENKIKKLDKLGVMSIQIPLDTTDRETYAKIKGSNPEQFDKILENLKLIKKTNMHHIVSCVLTKMNKDAPSKLMKFCYEQDIDTLSIFQPIVTGYCTHENLFSISEYLKKMKEIIDEFITYDRKWLIDIEGPTFESYDWLRAYSKQVKVNFAGCKAGRRICALSADGYLIPCPCMDIPIFYEGNIRKNSLKDMWESGFKLFRQPPEECRGCKQYKGCMGGCRVLAYGYTKKVDGMDPTCFKLNKNIFKTK